MSIFTGAGVAIVTPFTHDGQVNYEKLDQLVDWQINEGTDAIIICGTTGESPTLTMDEHKEVIRRCVIRTAGRVPVIAGTGSNCTETAIELSMQAKEDGADAILVVTPYYNKATQKGLVRHYKAISDAVRIPLIMYNVPGRTGCNIKAETAVEIARVAENVVAIKDATGDMAQSVRMAHLASEDSCLDIYSGEDALVVPLMSVGGLGVISVLSNVCPKLTHEMAAACLNGDFARGQELQLKMLPLIEALFCEVNPIPVKAAMNVMGLDVGPLRAPLTEMEPQNLERLKKAMSGLGLI